MSRIISIGTALPEFRHEQQDILKFMQTVYALNEKEKRKLNYLFQHSGIKTRFSILPDYSLPAGSWQFFPASENLEPFPSLEKRMKVFHEKAGPLALKAVRNSLHKIKDQNITHLITVTCTGMSAPGLDLELMEALALPASTWRTSVNFMGCYAAIHALKMADCICRADKSARVLIVCVECCTLHFQKDYTDDNMTSSVLFSDGAAAAIITGDDQEDGMHIDNFYSLVSVKNKKEMAWEMGSEGFTLTLSGYIPDLIGEDFNGLVQQALKDKQLNKDDITHWCIHPGGKRILEAIHKSLGFMNGQFQHSYDVLRDYGNMSSPTVLFVLDKIQRSLEKDKPNKIFGAAFGPGLTMETFLLSA